MSPCLPRGNELLHMSVVCGYMICTLDTCVRVFIKCSCWPGLIFGSPRLSDMFTAAPQPQAVVPMAKLESEEPSNLEQRSLTDGDLVSFHGKTCASLALFSYSRTHIFFSLLEMGQQRIPAYWGNENIRQHTMPYFTAILGWSGMTRV